MSLRDDVENCDRFDRDWHDGIQRLDSFRMQSGKLLSDPIWALICGVASELDGFLPADIAVEHLHPGQEGKAIKAIFETYRDALSAAKPNLLTEL